MQHTQAVVFDLDGTLLDVRECFYWQFQELSRLYDGRSLSRQQIRSEAHGTTEQIVRRLIHNNSVPLEEILLTHQRLRLQAYDQHLRLYKGVEKMLIELTAQNIKIAALTAGNYLTVSCLDRTKIRHYFQLIVTADHVDQYKPHPEGLIMIMKDLRVHPERTVMIGDSVVDILTGKAAGVSRTIGVLHGFGDPQELKRAGADYVTEDLERLPTLLP